MTSKELQTKVLKVMWSCNTLEQLERAVSYANLASKSEVAIKCVDHLKFYVPFERCHAVREYLINNNLIEGQQP